MLAYRIAPGDWRISAMLMIVFLVGYVALVPYTSSNWPLTGDEPHYIAIAKSIWSDRDLDLANNSAECAIDPHVQVTDDGAWRPAHMIGLPLILALPVGVAGRVGAGLTMALMAACTIALTYLLAWQITGRRITALCSALVLGVTPPFCVYATMIYPEIAGALLLVVALVAINSADDSLWPYLILGLAAAAMPWLVIRFAPLSVALCALALSRAWGGQHRTRNSLAALGTCVVSAALYLAYNRYMYGNWSPVALYGIQSAVGARPLVFVKWATSFVGWLLDQRVGLFATAPVFILAVAGLWDLLRHRASAWMPIALVLLTGVLFGIVLPGFWVQWSPATRYLVVVLPVLALGIGHVASASHSAGVRALLVLATIVSVGVAGVVFARPWLAYNFPFAESQLWGALPQTDTLRPTSLFPVMGSTKTFKDKRFPLDQDVGNATGKSLYFPGIEGVDAHGGSVVPDQDASQGYASRLMADDQGSDAYLLARTYVVASEGDYDISVRLRSDTSAAPEAREESPVRVLLLPGAGDVTTSPLAVMEIPLHSLGPSYSAPRLVYHNGSPEQLVVRLEYGGRTPVWVDSIRIAHKPPVSRGWGLVAVWLAAIGVVTAVAVRSLAGDGDRRSEPGFGVAYAGMCGAALILMVIVYGSSPGSTVWRFDGEAMRRQTGAIRFDRNAHNMLAVSSRDAGFMAYGPYTCIDPGQYSATFRVRLGDTDSEGSVAAVAEATAGGGTNVLVSSEIVIPETHSLEYEQVRLTFEVLEPVQLEVRLMSTGLTEVWLDDVEVALVGHVGG
ncbi:MAG: ArnT family glycosyltransferase [Anaerolineae bacterium]